MNNHLVQLLKKWHPERDTRLWVLATVYKTIGPSYRKAGAMMLFNDLGQHYGLLSGGCLEADIQRQAARVMRSKRSLTVCYVMKTISLSNWVSAVAAQCAFYCNLSSLN